MGQASTRAKPKQTRQDQTRPGQTWTKLAVLDCGFVDAFLGLGSLPALAARVQQKLVEKLLTF